MMTPVAIAFIFLFLVIKSFRLTAGSIAKPNCSDICGNTNIPFPFGIGDGCYLEGFKVTCNNSFQPPKAFINSINLELLNVSLEYSTVTINNPVITSNCQIRGNSFGVSLFGSPFYFSDTQNKFTALGCDNLALMRRGDTVIGGCLSVCNVTNTDGGCYGVYCCQTTIPSYLKFINATLQSLDTKKNSDGGCRLAFLVDHRWFNSTYRPGASFQTREYVPAVLDWGVDFNTNRENSSIICSKYSYYILEQLNSSYTCYCKKGYVGNPYLPSGCQDVDECLSRKICSPGNCVNTPGGYYCTPTYTRSSKVKMIFIGISSGLGILFALIGGWWLYKVVKRRKRITLKRKFFKQNGGLLLQQKVISSDGSLDSAKLFTSKELEKATDRYNSNRILGQGGQGTVYKGMLTDGKIVAVKKSKIVDEEYLEQFINEVVILSQINHRNVVKLLGFCLETEVPLLVYEFIPNGTLSEYIFKPNEDFPLTWEIRLRVATEVAGALFYLHSAASVPIYHRDVKSMNILLDDKYRAKVSDFGTSRSVAVDQTHLTTKVLGTFGYMDPEYFQSSQFTDKSDVYSFGVVLVELLTGKKPISSTGSEEERSLANHFLVILRQERLFEIIDTRILKDGNKEEIMAVALVARRCLNLSGKKRPTMKEVAGELENIRMSEGSSITQQTPEEYDYATIEIASTYWDSNTNSVSTSYLENSTSVPWDVQPLL